MKAITLIQILLLQKPSKRSKTKEHIGHLKRRLDLWSKGDIQQLLEEGRCIQARLIYLTAPGKNEVDGHIFRSLMAQGKVRSALSLLSREQSGGVLGLDDIIPQSQGLTTRDVLRDKHPPSKPACPESLLPDSSEDVNPIICRRTARLLARKTSLDLRSLVKINIDDRQIRSNVTDTQRILYTQLTT